MKIIVLMKQVPDTEAPVEIAESKDHLDTGNLKWTINPYDEYALEEALLIKEKHDNVEVTVATVGPNRVSESIRVAYAMGVDHAVHINDEFDQEQFAAVDPFTTSRLIAALLKETPYDLIIAGNRAVDDDNYQVPAYLSKMLDIPLITLITRQELQDTAIVCEQSIDGGTAMVKAGLPAIITVQKGLNEPRYPTFRAIMKAKKREVAQREIADLGFAPDDLGIKGAKSVILRMDYPPQRGGGKIITGAGPVEKASELVRLLKEEASVI